MDKNNFSLILNQFILKIFQFNQYDYTIKSHLFYNLYINTFQFLQKINIIFLL